MVEPREPTPEGSEDGREAPDAAAEDLQRESFGGLITNSPAMRAVMSTLRRAAPTNAPVLLTGESGTGKELAARAVHAASARAAQALEVVDCGGLPTTLIESELFGHERGAFTGASEARAGAFERAHGGTVFLDEIGEMPLEVQPKLLRALGEGEVRRIGARSGRKVDVRVIAATNRDLRREIAAGRFRSDLYYRLAVIRVHLPALRDRLEDLPLIAGHLLERIAAENGVDPTDVQLDPMLWRRSWPGNVRELRNYLEQLVILRETPPLPEHEMGADRDAAWGDTRRGAPGLEDAGLPGPGWPDAGWPDAGWRDAGSPDAGSLDAGSPDAGGRDAVRRDAGWREAAWREAGRPMLETLPLTEARALVVERLERRYLRRLLERTGGNAAEAARQAGVSRATLFRLIQRHALREPRRR